MSMHLFALHESKVRNFVNGIRQATETQDHERWQVVYETLRQFRPPSELKFRTVVAPPYTQVSHHTSPALGWSDFTPDEVPAPDDGRLAWILRLVVLGTAEHVFKGRLERFTATFCVSLANQDVFRTPDERAEFELYQMELFYASDRAIPPEFSFLKGDPHQAYLRPADVARFAETERTAAFLTSAAERVGGTTGYELLRIGSFMDFVETEGCAIYFNDPAT